MDESGEASVSEYSKAVTYTSVSKSFNDYTTVPTSRQQTILIQFYPMLSIYNLRFIKTLMLAPTRRPTKESKRVGVLVFYL